MRIVFLLEHIEYGGLQVVAFNIIKHLIKNKHTVLIVYTDSSVGDFMPDVDKMAIGPFLKKNKQINFINFESFRKMKRAIKDFNPDIIQSICFLPGIITGILFRPTAPIVVISATPIKRGFKLLNSILVHFFIDKIIITSDYHKSVFPFKVNQNKFSIVPNPIDIDRIVAFRSRWLQIREENGLNATSFILAGVGRLTQVKQFDVFIETIDLLKDKISNLKGIIIGDGEERESLNNLVKAKGLEDIISLLGPQANAIEIMAATDVFLHTSRWEMQPMVLIEACAVGLPVVCSNIGSNKTIIENGINGLVVDLEKGAPGYAECVLTIFYDKKVAASLSVNAKRIAKAKFDINAVIPQLINVYNSLIGNNK